MRRLRWVLAVLAAAAGTYNVTDYRWFNLRDGDSRSPNFQVRYGLLRDDSSRKPAFGRYRGLVAALSGSAG